MWRIKKKLEESQLEDIITERPKFRRQKSDHKEEREYDNLPPMPPLEGDKKELKEKKGLKILTPNKLLTNLLVLFAQIKAGNNSYKLRTEIRQIVYLLYQHNKITKKLYNKLIKSL